MVSTKRQGIIRMVKVKTFIECVVNVDIKKRPTGESESRKGVRG